MINSLRPVHPPVFRPCRNLLAVCFAWMAALALIGWKVSSRSLDPTEASFAASLTRSDTGDDTAILAPYAVWKSTSASLDGSRQPSGGGIFDLAENVEELISQNCGHPETGPTLAVAWGKVSSTTPESWGVVNSWQIGTNRLGTTGFRVVPIGQKEGDEHEIENI